MIACILIQGFYSNAYSQRRGYELSIPVVIHQDRIVLCVNSAAEMRGCRVGMSLSEARTLIPEGQLAAYSPDDYFDASRGWLDRCLSLTSRVEVENESLGYLDLAQTPGPGSMLANLLSDLEAIGWQAKVGLAPAKWIAKIAARQFDWRAHKLGLLTIESADAQEMLADTTVHALPIDGVYSRRLEFLGYRTIGQLQDAPLTALRSQFGKHGMRIYQLARANPDVALTPNYPPECVISEQILAGGVEDYEVLSNSIYRMAASLSTQLIRLDLEGRKLRLWVEFEDRSTLMSERVFSRSLRQVQALNVSLKLMLDGLNLQQPVTRLRTMMPELTAANLNQSAFDAFLSLPQKQQRADRALRHVRAVFGESAVQPANLVAVDRRTRVLRAWKDALEWR